MLSIPIILESSFLPDAKARFADGQRAEQAEIETMAMQGAGKLVRPSFVFKVHTKNSKLEGKLFLILKGL